MQQFESYRFLLCEKHLRIYTALYTYSKVVFGFNFSMQRCCSLFSEEYTKTNSMSNGPFVLPAGVTSCHNLYGWIQKEARARSYACECMHSAREKVNSSSEIMPIGLKMCVYTSGIQDYAETVTERHSFSSIHFIFLSLGEFRLSQSLTSMVALQSSSL